jgi:hypothetical protein
MIETVSALTIQNLVPPLGNYITPCVLSVLGSGLGTLTPILKWEVSYNTVGLKYIHASTKHFLLYKCIYQKL